MSSEQETRPKDPMKARYDAFVAHVLSGIQARFGAEIAAEIARGEQLARRNMIPGVPFPTSGFMVYHQHGAFHVNVPSGIATDEVMTGIDALIETGKVAADVTFERTMRVKGGSNFVIEGYLSQQSAEFWRRLRSGSSLL